MHPKARHYLLLLLALLVLTLFNLWYTRRLRLPAAPANSPINQLNPAPTSP